MPELARLGLLVAEAERQRQAPREGASAQVEHARTFDPAIADQGHVRGAAPDVDEDAALGPRLLARASSRTTVSMASMWVIGANVLKTVISRFLPVKPTGLVTG